MCKLSHNHSLFSFLHTHHRLPVLGAKARLLMMDQFLTYFDKMWKWRTSKVSRKRELKLHRNWCSKLVVMLTNYTGQLGLLEVYISSVFIWVDGNFRTSVHRNAALVEQHCTHLYACPRSALWCTFSVVSLVPNKTITSLTICINKGLLLCSEKHHRGVCIVHICILPAWVN